MSFNEYMHSRNRYRLNPPNFKELAEKHESLKGFLIEKKNGGVTLDFRDANAVRALTIALAKEDFHLDLELHLGRTTLLFSPSNIRVSFHSRSINTKNSTEIELSSLDRRFVTTSDRCHWDRYRYEGNQHCHKNHFSV